MVDYRSITIELHSQYDIESLPEYSPPTDFKSDETDSVVPLKVDRKSATRSTYVPVFPGSQFWISYCVNPPFPPDGVQFLFKLFINEEHIMNWSCGQEEEWKGKTMFGLYERENEEDGKKRIEKRVLCFTPPTRKTGEWEDVTNVLDAKAYIEIRVHRAHGRKRIAREMEQYGSTPHAKNGRGISLVNAGRASSDHPKRFYKFALIDPVDQPFARFHYYYRTWEQLEYLGIVVDKEETEGDDEDSKLPVIEPGEPDPEKKTSEGRLSLRGGDGLEDVFTDVRLSDDEEDSVSTPCFYVPTGAHARRGVDLPRVEVKEGESAKDKVAPRLHRLSVPPSLRLIPPPLQPTKDLPSVPSKSEPASPTGYRPHPVYPVEEWTARTPSPVKSLRDGISTPPLGRRRAFTATPLLNVLASAWKRRGPSSEHSNDGGSRQEHRDVS